MNRAWYLPNLKPNTRLHAGTQLLVPEKAGSTVKVGKAPVKGKRPGSGVGDCNKPLKVLTLREQQTPRGHPQRRFLRESGCFVAPPKGAILKRHVATT